MINNVHLKPAVLEDLETLVALRIQAMKPSLVALGRFDPERARARFVEGFVAKDTIKILCGEQLCGFYVLREETTHLHLAHFYLHPAQQGKGLGGEVLGALQKKAAKAGKPIQLGALKKSPANGFYMRHGFVKTHEETWDNHYIYRS